MVPGVFVVVMLDRCVSCICAMHCTLYDVFDNPGGLIMSRVASRSLAMLY